MQAGGAFPSSVLVVDDEPVVLDILERALPAHGLTIRTARSADEAIALLDREGFGCILADKNLPGLDGIELVRRVRRSQPYCACIVMTAYSSMESAVAALRLGAVDYLEKPFDDLDAIGRRIEEAVKAMRAEYERQAVLSRLRVFQGEVSQNDPTPEESEPEPALATPVEILEARVQNATSELRRRSLHLLSRLVASKAAGREVLLSGEGLLDEVRAFRKRGGADLAELRRIEEKVEAHLALARHAQAR